MANFWGRMAAGVKAFREAYFAADSDQQDVFGSASARQTRYAVLWAYFENTAYRDIHTWAHQLKVDFGLYQYTRNIYSPAQRIGDFGVTHLMGGTLDAAAGDGTQEPSALPILTDNAALRPALAQLWQDSNWQTKKDVLTLWGTVLGDVALRVMDDPARGKVYLDVVHPSTLASVALDTWGNVKAYAIEEQRLRPDQPDKYGLYREEATRDGVNVVYRTLLDGQPFAWNGVTAEWAEPYGFVPLVLIQHRNVGLDWGWAEAYPALAKIREIDDLASMTSDQIRKLVNAPWLFAGVTKPIVAPRTLGAAPTTDSPEPGRQELPALYGPLGATATALVANLDLAGTLAHVQNIISGLEADFPEIRADIETSSGDASGRALRIARQAAEGKVKQRRANYDDGLVRAHMMAVAIGGLREYKDYSGFGLDSYAAGALAHRIGPRPVFAVDTADEAAAEGTFWQNANLAVKAGLPLAIFLARNGWTKREIAEVVDSAEHQARLAGMEAARLGLSTLRGNEAGTMQPQDEPV